MGYRDGYENLTDAVQGTLENMQSLAFTAVVGVFCLVMIGYAVFKHTFLSVVCFLCFYLANHLPNAAA